MIVTVRREGAEEQILHLDAPEVTLGKSRDCAVVLDHPVVSRRHARLLIESGRIIVEDLGSTNGTELGGRTVDGRRTVGPAEVIRIGPFSITARTEEVTPARDPSPAAAVGTATMVENAASVGVAPNVDAKLGPLSSLFADDRVSEVMVNGPDEIFFERNGRLELAEVRFSSSAAIVELVTEIAKEVGRTLDERRPMLDARLRDGSRVNAILPPLSLRGPCVTIRRFPRDRHTAEQLVELGSLSTPMLSFLRAAIVGKMNLLVSGGTGSGKTTVLNALCGYIGERERVITIEDAAELRLPQRHVIPLETRPPDPDGYGEVTVRDLVRNALRMRPDRIVVGEVRGAEALDMLQAMNTGHDGSLSTIHANSPREALSRLETLALFAGTELPTRALREQICGAITLLVHAQRMSDARRRVTSIAELTGMEGDRFTIGEIFRFEGGSEGGFRPAGYIPRCRERLLERGQEIDNAWFR